MNHNITVVGLAYQIRPVKMEDASFIVDTRLQDAERNKFLHRISSNISLQKKWIAEYFNRDGDYYFVVENRLTGEPEGLIGFYGATNEKAEWGRWVIRKESMATIESLDLICQAAFTHVGLKELYCRTIENNVHAVSFHNSAKEKLRGTLIDFFEIDGNKYNAIEHYIDADYYKTDLSFLLQQRAQLIFDRNLKLLIGEFSFHHIAVACTDFEKEIHSFKFLGYRQESPIFIDKKQGIEGCFLIAQNQPRIELLRNLDGSHTLDFWLKNKTKMYHFAYQVANFDRTVEILIAKGAKVIKSSELASYFGKRICFMVLPNMFMIELVEK